MHTDPRVDAYIAKAADFARPILEHVRVLAHKALPELEETLKWGVPHFTVGGKNAVGMAAFKAHAAVIVHGEDASGEGMGNLGKIASREELPPDEELIARFKAAAAGIASGKPRRSAAKPKPEIPCPTISRARSMPPRRRERPSTRWRRRTGANISSGSPGPGARKRARSGLPRRSNGSPKARSATGSTRTVEAGSAHDRAVCHPAGARGGAAFLEAPAQMGHVLG